MGNVTQLNSALSTSEGPKGDCIVMGKAECRPEGSVLLFVGSYTRETLATGISAYSFDPVTGQIRYLCDNAGIDNPSFICLHPLLPVLYCVNEVPDYLGRRWGSVSAYGVDRETGKLTLLSQQPSMGANPCHLSVDPSGQVLFVSNYSGGSLVVFALLASGEIGDFLSLIEHHGRSVDPVRQIQAHVHCALSAAQETDPQDHHEQDPSTYRTYIYVVDLGLDEVAWYPVNPGRGLVRGNARRAVRLRPGAGPRHLCFDGNGTHAYLITELDNTLITLDRSPASGELIEMSTQSLLPEGCDDPNYGAHIVLSEDGRFLYGSNRGHDSIVTFQVDSETGMPRLLGHVSVAGIHPRHFSLSADQHYLLVANKDSNQVVCFARDRATGLLSATDIQIDTPSPACLQFMD
jgi:6-phosphogluconolactonase